MTFNDYFYLFLGMGLATYLPRALPLIYLAHRRLPQGLVDWLGFIPAAVLSALLAPSLFLEATEKQLVFDKPEFLVAIPTLIFAWKTRSLGGTVFFGMFLYWLAGRFL